MRDFQTVRRRIDDNSVQVAVLGLGYVGLPLALTFVEQTEIRVNGFDVDHSKIHKLLRGESYIGHLHQDRIQQAHESGRFLPTADLADLDVCDVLIVTVPTPLTPEREPDMTYIRSTMESVAARLRGNQLVILESTTYPGTTDEFVQPILQKSGREFWLAYSPEREDPGNKDHLTAGIPRLVGGIDDQSTELAAALYRKAIHQVIEVPNARIAEAAKLTENVFRCVNIALVNELKVTFDRMGIDIWEVLDAAATKPFGFMRFDPGPGLGGHCIPIDPFYLVHAAKQVGAESRFIELAAQVNLAMPGYVLQKLREGLGRDLVDLEVLVLGLSYKKNVDDPRESPAFEVISQLLGAGAKVRYHDPHLPRTPVMRSWPNLPPMTSVPLSRETLTASDAVVLVTDHDDIDYGLVQTYAPLIVDPRGVYRAQYPNVVKA